MGQPLSHFWSVLLFSWLLSVRSITLLFAIYIGSITTIPGVAPKFLLFLGQLKPFHLVKDVGVTHSKGYAYVAYSESHPTEEVSVTLYCVNDAFIYFCMLYDEYTYPKKVEITFFIIQIIATINSSGLMIAQRASAQEVSTDFHFLDKTVVMCSQLDTHNSCIGITINIG